MLTSSSNNATYVKIPYKVDDLILEFKFLVDTGASVSLIKTEKLKRTKLLYNPSEILTLDGLSANAPITTAGSVILKPTFHDKQLDIKFHIVKGPSRIPWDGILGNDFLKEQGAKIDLNKLELRLNSLPFAIKLWLNSNPNDQSSYILKPRSETVIKVNILNPQIKEGITPKLHIYDAKSILKVESNTSITTILNTTDEHIKVDKIDLVLEKFDENTSSIFHVDRTKTNSYRRLELLKDNLRLTHLNDEEKKSVQKICEDFNDIFHLPGDMLTHTDAIQHEITVTDPTPISTKIYEAEVDRQISKMIEQDIIVPSTSPYNSPLWVVPKKDDASGARKWRIVVDYRKLNDVTVGDSYPLPSIEHILDQLGYSKYFTTLDLASGFHQIKIKSTDATKTAFSTPQNHYEYKRMPFGLKTAPSTFQRLMNTVLAGLHGSHAFVYLDDIVV
jgi:hypothetical protein